MQAPAQSQDELQVGQQQVHTRRHPQLRQNRVLRPADEAFHLQMLLDPLEKQLDLPPRLVQVGNRLLTWSRWFGQWATRNGAAGRPSTSPMCAAAAGWSTSSKPFTCSADLQAVERPPPRRACSKSARMMTSPLRHGHVTGDANHTSTAKRVTPPRPEMWSARCFTAAVAEGSGLAPDRNGNQGRSIIFRHDRQARRVTLRRFAARDSGGAGQPSRDAQRELHEFRP